MNRRTVLGMAPAAIAVGVVPAFAQTDTPVMALFRKWERFNAQMNGGEARALDDEEFDARMQDLNELGQRLMETPAQNAQDIVAKVISWTDSGGFELPGNDEPFWAEARAVVA